MKVNNVGSQSPRSVSDGDVMGKTEKADTQFSAELFKTQDASSKERLNVLLQQITDQGKKLGEAPTYPELKNYRELVRNFLGEVVSRAYTLKANIGWDRQGRQKMYSTIKEIDKHLTGLAEDVRQGQERQLAIMSRLDAIRGMLVDLYT